MWIQHLNKKTLASLIAAGALLAAPTRRMESFGDPIGNYNFRVEIDGVAAGTFTAVDGLSVETEVVEYRDGEDIILRKRPGRTKYSNITLKRGIISTSYLWEWRKAVLESEPLEKKTGSVILTSDDGSEIMRYNFFEAWPCKWKGFTLDGKGNDVAVEEIELAVERIERD